MMRITLPLLLAMPALAQTVYLPVPATGFCEITGATNAAPIVITVSDMTKCGLANGDTVVILDVDGNYAANIHVEAAGEDKHLGRKVVSLSGDTFAIQDMTDTNVAGSGTFASGTIKGIVFKAAPYTVQSSFGQWLDGSGGTLYNRMLDTASAGRKNAANPAYVRLQAISDIYIGGTWNWGWAWTPGTATYVDAPGRLTLSAALRYMVDGTTAARDRALEDLRYPDQLTGGVSCHTRTNQCGLPTSSVADYSRQMVEFYAMTYQIMKSVSTAIFTPTERKNLLNYFYNDHPWTKGGIDYTAAAHTAEDFVFGWSGGSQVTNHGTWTAPYGSTTVTGAGTSFISDGCAPGLIFWLGGQSSQNGYAKPSKIASCDSETQITLARPVDYDHSGATPCNGQVCRYQFGKAWDDTGTQMGLEFINKHYAYQGLNGNGVWYTPDTPDSEFLNNLYLSGHQGSMAKGLAGCADGDRRGCVKVIQTAGSFYHRQYRGSLVVNGGGFNFGSLDYSGRINNQIARMLHMLKFGVISGPDYAAAPTNSSSWNIARQYMHSWLGSVPGVAMPQGGEPAESAFDSAHVVAALIPMLTLGPSHDVTTWMKHWLNNTLGFTSGFIRNSDAAEFYAFYEPGAVAAAPPTSNVADNSYDECATGWTASRCAPSSSVPGRRGGLQSRSSWDADATIVGVQADSYFFFDHAWGSPPIATIVVKNGKRLIWGDHLGGYASGVGYDTPNRNFWVLGGNSNFKATPTVTPAEVTVPWRLAHNNFGYLRIDMSSLYKSNVTLAERQVLHIKGHGGIVHDYATASSSIPMCGVWNLGLNGSGTPASPGSAAVNRAAKTFTNNYSGAAGITGKVFKLGGSGSDIAMITEAGSDADLSYAGQNGNTGQFRICNSNDGSTSANGTVGEYVVVWETNTGSESLPTIATPQIVGNHRIVEVQGASPWVAAFVRGGASSPSLSFTTSFSGTGRYGITGLDAATYAVTVGGSPVSGSPFTVTSVGRSLTFDGASGAVVIAKSAARAAPATGGGVSSSGRVGDRRLQ